MPRCKRILLVNATSALLDGLVETAQGDGLAVVRVRRPEAALLVLRSGYSPDAIVVDLPDGVAAHREFLRLLYEDPRWRQIPVIGASTGAAGVWFQVAPRHHHRKLPAPDDGAQFRTLLDVVAPTVEAEDMQRTWPSEHTDD